MSALSDDGLAYLSIDHNVNPDDEFDFHEWWTRGTRIKADRRGHPNPRMLYADWLIYTCNNIDCAAQMWVKVDRLAEHYFPVPRNPAVQGHDQTKGNEQ